MSIQLKPIVWEPHEDHEVGCIDGKAVVWRQERSDGLFEVGLSNEVASKVVYLEYTTSTAHHLLLDYIEDLIQETP